MFYVLSGWAEKLEMSWLRGKVNSDQLARLSHSGWYKDKVIRDALRDVDDVVRIDEDILINSEGRKFLCDWLSQGSQQFLMMAVMNYKVCDGFYFGHNVYKHFYRWSKEHDKDVTILANSMLAMMNPELQGIYLNTGDEFKSGDELADLIGENRKCILSDNKGGYIEAQKYVKYSEEDIRYGDISKIVLPSNIIYGKPSKEIYEGFLLACKSL